jgi:hypothetical protein
LTATLAVGKPSVHATTHAVRPSQQSLRPLQIVRPQRLAQLSAADALAIDQHRSDHIDFETELRTALGAPLRTGFTAPAEPKIMSDNHAPRPRRAQQLHELQSREHPQTLAERQNAQPVQPHRGQQPPTLAKIGEPRGWIRCEQILARHRFERHQHRRQPQLLAGRSRSLNQRLMAQVDAVEAADRDDTITRIDRIESADKLHDPLSAAFEPSRRRHRGQNGNVNIKL